jgi:hypothetical protein
MSAFLHPCSGCHRHVKTSESACPFCGAALEPRPVAAAAPIPAGSVRISRAALLGLTAAGALSASLTLADCTSVPVYGAPYPDTGGAGGVGGAGGSGGAGGEGGADGG